MIKSPVFVTCLSLYSISLWDKFFQLNFPQFFKNYLADFLCLPIVLTFTLFLIRKLKKQETIQLSILKIGVAFAYVSIFFEGFLPFISSNYTADYWDVLAYFLGATYFYIIQKKYFNFNEFQN